MKTKSVSINAVLNIIKSLLSVVFPLIMYPYASRVLGVENIGKVNYGASIVSYFSLIAVFGLTSYAIREGAKVRDDRNRFKTIANELFTVNVITTVFAYALLIACILCVPKLKDYSLLILLQSCSIAFTTLGVDWINTIYEDYLYTTIRGIITHVLSLLLLFIIVKDRGDYYQYAFLTVLSNAVTCMLNFMYCRRYVHFKIIRNPHIKQHLKRMIIFFANAVAVSIYVSADTTMLGWMIGDYSVGIYSTAVKIYSIVKLLLVAVYSVALARLSFFFGAGKHEEYKTLFTNITSTLLLLLLPVATGTFVFSDEIIMFIGGPEFSDAAGILKTLSVAFIFAILGGVLTQCLNISVGKETVNAKATIISAVANVVLNIPFIYFLKESGAAITTVMSEAIVFIYCLIFSWNYIKQYLDKKVLTNLLHSVAGVLIVIAAYYVVGMFDMNYWLRLILGIAITGCVYLLFLLMVKNEIIDSMLHGMLAKIKRRK